MSAGCKLSLRERESESELCGLIEQLHAGAAHAPGVDQAGGAVMGSIHQAYAAAHRAHWEARWEE